MACCQFAKTFWTHSVMKINPMVLANRQHIKSILTRSLNRIGMVQKLLA